MSSKESRRGSQSAAKEPASERGAPGEAASGGQELAANPRSALSYGSYLCLPQLLELQQPVSEGPEHDELLFITTHQVYELWFKQLLHESGALARALQTHDAPRVVAVFKRVLTILKTAVAMVDILETMTPSSFNSFRTRLESASGFQSAQFRAFEFALGYKRPNVLKHYPEGSRERAELERRLHAPTVWDAFLCFLAGRGVGVTPRSDVTLPVRPDSQVQKALLEAYAGGDLTLHLVNERMVDLDEGLQEWRYRHVKMVERTIGDKQGTGGSSGAAYLKSTLFRPLFPDLWAIRTGL